MPTCLQLNNACSAKAIKDNIGQHENVLKMEFTVQHNILNISYSENLLYLL